METYSSTLNSFIFESETKTYESKARMNRVNYETINHAVSGFQLTKTFITYNHSWHVLVL